MSTLALTCLSLAFALSFATLGALLTRGWWDWRAWRARRDLTMALATRARAAEVMAEAQQVRKVYDDLPEVDPRKCWGAEIHQRWEVLRQERDEARSAWEEICDVLAVMDKKLADCERDRDDWRADAIRYARGWERLLDNVTGEESAA